MSGSGRGHDERRGILRGDFVLLVLTRQNTQGKASRTGSRVKCIGLCCIKFRRKCRARSCFASPAKGAAPPCFAFRGSGSTQRWSRGPRKAQKFPAACSRAGDGSDSDSAKNAAQNSHRVPHAHEPPSHAGVLRSHPCLPPSCSGGGPAASATVPQVAAATMTAGLGMLL